MSQQCEECPLYKEKLDELLRNKNSSYDIVIDMYEFIKTCKCPYNINNIII